MFQSLLGAAELSKEEANFYITRLDEYRWKLRVSSISAEVLEQSIATIDRSAEYLRIVGLDDSKYMQEAQNPGIFRNAYSESSIDRTGYDG